MQEITTAWGVDVDGEQAELWLIAGHDCSRGARAESDLQNDRKTVPFIRKGEGCATEFDEQTVTDVEGRRLAWGDAPSTGLVGAVRHVGDASPPADGRLSS